MATREAEARYDRIESSRRASTDIDASADAMPSTTLASLRAQYARARARYAELATELGPLNPALRQIESHIEELRRAITEEVERIAQAAREDLARARDAEAAQEQAINRERRQMARMKQVLPRLRELEGEVETSRDVYQTFLRRWRENGDQESPASSTARVVGAAVAAQQPDQPPELGLLAAIGAVLGAVATAALLVRIGRTPAAAVLPPADETSAPEPAPEAETAVVAAPPLIAEADPPPAAPPASDKPLIARLQETAMVRMQSEVLGAAGALPDLTRIGWPTLGTGLPVRPFLKTIGEMRATMMRRPRAGAIPVIALIGAGHSEDRSIAALNVALAAARNGARVLLIEADHGARMLSQRLQRAGHARAGRFGWLGIGARPATIIETSNGIAVLAADRASMSKSSDRICRTIAEVRSLGGYDLVILDGPAMPWRAAESRLLDTADGLVAVLPVNADINDGVGEIIRALGDAERKLVGFVLSELHASTAPLSEPVLV
jgi:Mrp family chromosome partitioning ATPase